MTCCDSRAAKFGTSCANGPSGPSSSRADRLLAVMPSHLCFGSSFQRKLDRRSAIHRARLCSRSSFRREPESILILLCSCSFADASLRLSPPVRGAGHFLLLVQEKVTKEDTPRMARRLRRCARACRGSLNAHSCACNELARIVRAILRTFPSCPRRGKRGPEDHELDQKRPLPPFGHLPPLRRGRESLGFLLLPSALDRPPPSPHRASQAPAGERRACPSAGMREFAPARRRREAQGTFA